MENKKSVPHIYPICWNYFEAMPLFLLIGNSKIHYEFSYCMEIFLLKTFKPHMEFRQLPYQNTTLYLLVSYFIVHQAIHTMNLALRYVTNIPVKVTVFIFRSSLLHRITNKNGWLATKSAVDINEALTPKLRAENFVHF